MITSVGPTGFEQILRELKKSEVEDQQVYRQQANSFFDQRISELEAQAKTMRKQASKIGAMGIFNLVMNIVTAGLSIASNFMSAVKGAAVKKLTAILDMVQKGLTVVQKFINDFSEMSQKKLEAQAKEHENRAEIKNKEYEMIHEQEMDSKKRAAETLATLRETRRDITEAHESMVKI